MGSMERNSLNKGHRERLKKRFLDQGIDGFEMHNVLELLLFFGIPYRDTNVLAHQLIKEFGSFSAVLDAPFEALCAVPGVGNNTATLLKLVPEIARIYLTDKTESPQTINHSEDAVKLIAPRYFGVVNEAVTMICLDSSRKVLDICSPFKGTVDLAVLQIRTIISLLLKRNATAVILVHNHPAADAQPSSSDVKLTDSLKKLLAVVGISLLDHIILSNDRYFSFADNDLLS